MPDGGLSAPQQRGQYLVNAVLDCNHCHTPLKPDRTLDTTKLLSGVDCLLDVVPGSASLGCVSSRNLTNHPTGLMNRTDDEIKKAITTGERFDGTRLISVMPTFVFHQLSDSDLSAVVAYLRTVPGVDHTITPSQPPLANPTKSPTPVDDADVPPAGGTGAVHDSAVRGRYLASIACLDCHTPNLASGDPRPIDMTKPYQGNRAFVTAYDNIPSPPFPDVIYTWNLTPDQTGLMGWTADQIVAVLKQGKDPMGKGICPPMPAGMAGFAGLTDQDAMDIANYIVSLSPKANMITADCVPPAP
jgi:mono/diheme cytochrome c family protein